MNIQQSRKVNGCDSRAHSNKPFSANNICIRSSFGTKNCHFSHDLESPILFLPEKPLHARYYDRRGDKLALIRKDTDDFSFRFKMSLQPEVLKG